MASRRRLRRLLAAWQAPAARACDGKPAFANRTDAERAAVVARRRKDDSIPLRAYACPHCGRWHVGHVPLQLRRLLEGAGAGVGWAR